MVDAHKNFAYSLVATAPDTATAGTSLVVTADDGAKFPAVPFNATIWPAGEQPLTTNAEIVRVTTVSTDTLTIARAQESSTARSVVVGDQIAATITAKTLKDVEKALTPDLVIGATGDYATLGAAITATAVSSGMVISFQSETITETGACSTAATDLTLIGSGKYATNWVMGADSTLSGANVQVKDMKITAAAGFTFIMTGEESSIENCYLYNTALDDEGFRMETGKRQKIDNCLIESTDTTPSQELVEMLGESPRFTNNYVYSEVISIGAGLGCISIGGAKAIVTNNTFRPINTATGYALATTTGASYANISNNTFYEFNGSGTGIYSYGTYARIDANTFHECGEAIKSDNTDCTISNNTIHLLAADTGVLIDDQRGYISGNFFMGTTNTECIKLTSSSATYGIIDGNFFNEAAKGIVTAGYGADYKITNNFFNTVAAPIDAVLETMHIENNVGYTSPKIGPAFQHTMRYITNDSGGALVAGNVVITASSADGEGITTTTTGGDPKVCGMLIENVANAATGRILVAGKTTLLKVDGTTDIAVGDLLSTFTTAGIAKKAIPGETAFAIALEAYATNDAAGVIDALIITPRQLPSVGLEAYPVGAVYASVVSTSPATLFGGTWSAFGAGRVLVGIDAGNTAFDTVEEAGGAETVTLTAAQSGTTAHGHGVTDPTHNHDIDAHDIGTGTTYNANTGGATGRNRPTAAKATGLTVNTSTAAAAAEAHTNLQPYIVVYFWKRTA